MLKDYELDLEDLTFNSKPIINTLTMKAEKHRDLAPELIDLIQTRFFKVATALRTSPSLISSSSSYLINSVISKWFSLFINVVMIFFLQFKQMLPNFFHPLSPPLYVSL